LRRGGREDGKTGGREDGKTGGRGEGSGGKVGWDSGGGRRDEDVRRKKHRTSSVEH